MANYHLSIKIISRGKGKSAVAAAAYRAGEKITNEYDGVTHDYTRKGGVVHTEILLPDHAPVEYTDRAVLWNAVEKIEKAKNSQLAREIEISLPVELSREQNIALTLDYVKQHFVDKGMCADLCIHDKNDGNPHAHILLTMRPFNDDKTWGDKQKKEYILDKNGEKIFDKKKRSYKCTSITTTDWNEQTKAEEWRAAWADAVNMALEQRDIAERVDHRSYARQGVEKVPTVHLGAAASQMEKRGIATDRGNINRQINITNNDLRQLRARINKLHTWLEREAAITETPTLADVIQSILSRRAQAGQSSISRSLYNLKDASKILNFLTDNNIMDMTGLEEKVKSMYGKQDAIRVKLKPIDRRLKTLDEHTKQAEYYQQFREIYQKYKQLKPRKQKAFYDNNRREIMLYEAADRYFTAHMNGQPIPPMKKWREEHERLTAEKSKLYQSYNALQGDVREVEIIRRSVYEIMRQEQRERQPTRARGMER